MAGQRVLSGGHANSKLTHNLLHSQNSPPSSHSFDALFLSGSSPFLGSRSMVSFEDVNGEKGRKRSIFEENGDDEFDDYFHQPEKKRRLSADQVQFLEKSFAMENKLEPERKIQLAKELGLQPRQIAIWFQNRRARWKTKQLEKDYDGLQARYDTLQADYENLLKEKDKLKAEVLLLTEKVLLREKENGNMEKTNPGESLEPPQNTIFDSSSEDEVSRLSIVASRQEDINSTKSDIFDSDSSHYNDGAHSSIIEPGDSSYVFEPDQSDLSQDEEDNLSRSFLPSYIFPKLEYVEYSDPPESSCSFGFQVEDHAFWSWAY